MFSFASLLLVSTHHEKPEFIALNDHYQQVFREYLLYFHPLTYLDLSTYYHYHSQYLIHNNINRLPSRSHLKHYVIIKHFSIAIFYLMLTFISVITKSPVTEEVSNAKIFPLSLAILGIPCRCTCYLHTRIPLIHVINLPPTP